ncbi:MAG: hypothetical protein ACRCU1_14000 [Alsobacter sp.]
MPINAERLMQEARRALREAEIHLAGSRRFGWPPLEETRANLDAAHARLLEAAVAREHFGSRGSPGDMIHVSRLLYGATATMRVLARWPEGVPHFLHEKPVYLAIDKAGFPHRIFLDRHEPSVLDVFVDGLPFEEMARISNLITTVQRRT